MRASQTSRRVARWACFTVLGIAALLHEIPSAVLADALPQVQLVNTTTAPRALEAQTQQAIVRDYGRAWRDMATAFNDNSPALLSTYFTSDALKNLVSTIAGQQKSGLTTRYENQTHRIEIVFYAPEGDVIELHDTAGYDMQILDGGKQIYREHVAIHYVVLMTPVSDHWVVRGFQGVPEFESGGLSSVAGQKKSRP